MNPQTQDTTYAGPAPPRTNAEVLAFALSRIINNIVQPPSKGKQISKHQMASRSRTMQF
jgi:hypothetical protein